MSLTDRHTLPPLPPIWDSALLVYFRAEPAAHLLFPTSPFELLQLGRKSSLVVYAADNQQLREFSCTTVPGLREAINFVCHPEVSGRRRVVTIHALSMLGRLARWHAALCGVQTPPTLCPPSLIDLVDRVNSPAVLAYSARMSFRVADYVELLQLVPEPGVDPETGLLLNLLKRYGN